MFAEVRASMRCVPFSIEFVLDGRGQAEVSDLDLHFIVEKQIAQFEIAMNDALVVHVDARLDDLLDEVARFGLGHRLPSSTQFHQ